MTLFARRRWPWAVAAAGVLAAGALAAFLLTRDEPPGPAATGDPDIVETASPIPDPTLPGVPVETLLRAPDNRLRTYVEYQTTAENVPVQATVGPSAVWVGDSADERVLVVVVSGEFRVAAGARVSFSGVVQRGTRAFGEALGLTGDALDEFARQSAYVEVTEYRSA